MRLFSSGAVVAGCRPLRELSRESMKIPTRMGTETSTTVSPSVAAATRSSRRHSGFRKGQIGLSVSTSWKRRMRCFI